MDATLKLEACKNLVNQEFTKLKLLLAEVEKCKAKLSEKNVRLSLPDSITSAKQAVHDILVKEHGRVVANGPFANMKMNSQTWGGFDINAKILGTYESHVIDELIAISQTNSGPFIDIGAADGFFAIGAVISGIADETYAFEVNELSRCSIAINASDNNLSERIHIREIANTQTISDVLKKGRKAKILIDIEGGEYELLDYDFLDEISKCDVIVELHPSLIESGFKKQEELITRLENYFHIEFFKKSSLRATAFPELANLSDDKRLLALSENRAFEMWWIKLNPKT